jgi:hypothetical protein
MPGTSVQISSRAALNLAAKYAPDVSDPRPPLLLQGRIRREIAGRRQQAGLERGAGTRVGPQHLTRIHPRRADSLGAQERRAQRSREQFAHGHYARTKAVAHLAGAGHRVRHAPQILDETLEEHARHYAQCARKIAVPGIDLLENRRVRTAGGRRQKRLESIRDAGECGMNDDRSEGGGDAGPDYAGDVVPIGYGRHAGAAEFEHDPGSIIFRHSERRTLDFDSVAPNRAAPAKAELADRRRHG